MLRLTCVWSFHGSTVTMVTVTMVTITITTYNVCTIIRDSYKMKP